MTQEARTMRRQRQAEAIKRLAHGAQKGRGVHLRGLWACRMAAGLTQRQLAATIGANQNTIHELENQSRGAYPGTIRRLCEALEVEPADLICMEPHDNH